MAAVRISKLKHLFSLRSAALFHARPVDGAYAIRPRSRETEREHYLITNVFTTTGLSSAASRRIVASPSNRLLGDSGFQRSGISTLLDRRYFSSVNETKGNITNSTADLGASVTGASDGGAGGDGLIEKLKEITQSAFEGLKSTGGKVKEVSDEAAPHVQQWLDGHPYLRDVIVPVGGTLTATILAWPLLPGILKQFHKYSSQGPGALLQGSSIWGPVPYEKSFWGALEDPLRYFITLMAFLQIGGMVAPTVVASHSVAQVWRGALVVATVWFLNRWKANVIARALAAKSMERGDRDKLLTLDKISSVGLFAVGLMALAEASGVAVQSILTVGGIGGVATAFAARDILGNVLSGLSVQISQPFSIGDTIKAGSVEGQVVEMGLTTTSLLTAEKFPVIVPNSLFSSQVIVNKSRARWRFMIRKVPIRIDDIDKIPQISEDIKAMLRSNPNVFLEREAPYCFLSQIERSYAELTLGCNLKELNKEAEQDILLQAARIIKNHGAELGTTLDTIV